MTAGSTLIAVGEPRYKKCKVYATGPYWAPGAWDRGDVVWGKDGLQAMWRTSTRGPGVRAERYRKNLIKNKIPFTEFTHAPGKISGFSERSAVVEFIFFKGGQSMKHVIILNGAPRAGKGEFSAMFGDNAEVGSIIDGSKEIARGLFGWDGVKGAKGRKLLSDLYLASMAYNNGPLRDILALALSPMDMVAIIDVRDPGVIETFKGVLDMVSVPCTTVLIRREVAEVDAAKDGLPADCQTAEYDYNVELFNNGTLEDFKTLIRVHFKDLIPE